MSTGDILTTSSLRFHLTLFVRTYGEEAELSFDFEAEDMYTAGDKVLEVSRRISGCPGVLYWKFYWKFSRSFKSEPEGLNALPPFRCDGGQGLPVVNASPCGGSPFSSWRG